MSSRKKVKNSDERDAEAAILQWFECEGEPATVQSLTDSLGSRFGKSLVQTLLEQCVSEKKLQSKDIKKARFYFLISSRPDGEVQSDCSVDATKANLIQQVWLRAKRVSDFSAEMNALLQKPSSVERKASILAMSTECETLMQRLADSKQLTNRKRGRESEENISLLIGRYHRARELWRERKRMTERVIDAVLGESCNPKDLVDIFGLSTDEQLNLSLAGTSIALPPSTNTLLA